MNAWNERKVRIVPDINKYVLYVCRKIKDGKYNVLKWAFLWMTNCKSCSLYVCQKT